MFDAIGNLRAIRKCRCFVACTFWWWCALLILLIAVVGRLLALLRHSTLLSPTSILTEASRTYHSIVARIVGFSVQHRSHHAPDETDNNKLEPQQSIPSRNTPSPPQGTARQSRAKPGEHPHPRQHHPPPIHVGVRYNQDRVVQILGAVHAQQPSCSKCGGIPVAWTRDGSKTDATMHVGV